MIDRKISGVSEIFPENTQGREAAISRQIDHGQLIKEDILGVKVGGFREIISPTPDTPPRVPRSPLYLRWMNRWGWGVCLWGAGGTLAIGDRDGRVSVPAGGCPWPGSGRRLQKGPFPHRASAWRFAGGEMRPSCVAKHSREFNVALGETVTGFATRFSSHFRASADQGVTT